MITVTDLSKSYTEQVLFENASFFINAKERIGLVGRNGHGKSTLFKMMAGLEEPDSGIIKFPKDYRIGYLSQHLHFTEPTILAEGCKGLPKGAEFDQWKVEKVLMGLGFDRSDFERNPSEFSGGFQLRINLAKALVNEPDLMMLDEPTNFLDIISIRWMIKFLRAWPSELMLISHDRSFMDQVVTHVMGIHRQNIKKIPGKTGEYYEQVALEETFYEQERVRNEQKREQTMQFVDRFRAQATKASQVQSRIKALDKMGTQEKLSRIATLNFSFHSLPFPAKTMLHAHSLSFRYDAKQPLFQDLNLTIEKTDRICIIGKNGKGKTTLLKVLMGILAPTSGNIKTHPLLIKGYFEQANTADLHDYRTVEQEIMESLEKKSLQEARKICGLMMFTKNSALKKIEVLSGGEKSRVILGKLLAKPAHLLLLDEPTHHLDMPSSEAMADAISEFEGAAIVVTHDEDFLRRVATKLIIFHEDRTFVYEGKYDDFLAEIGWGDEAVKPKISTSRGNPKDERRARAQDLAKQQDILKPIQNKIKELEQQIETLEKQFAADTERIAKASAVQDTIEIIKLSKTLHDLRAKIDFCYVDLEEATQALELAKLDMLPSQA